MTTRQAVLHPYRRRVVNPYQPVPRWTRWPRQRLDETGARCERRHLKHHPSARNITGHDFPVDAGWDV